MTIYEQSRLIAIAVIEYEYHNNRNNDTVSLEALQKIKLALEILRMVSN